MNKPLIILSISIILVTIIITPLITEQFVDAKSTKKIHFTQTITSSQDPGQGHQNHQFALILSPNEGTLYDGSLTYTASEPVQIMVLHEIDKNEEKGQPTWTVDGNTIYGLTLIDTKTNSGTFEFTGTALALHNENKQFTTTVSIDGWIRGQPTEVLIPKTIIQKEESILKLSRSNIPVIIPMHEGFSDQESVFYIITDTNSQEYSEFLTEQQKWKVEFAPPLSHTPDNALNEVYVFKNGLKGNGIHNFQNEVFSYTPSQIDEYSALSSVIEVSWKRGQNPTVLESVDAILKAEESERIEIEKTDVILNMPQIIWQEGQMLVKDDKTLTNETPYGEGQVLDINEEEMTVTFVAHRGWGPDGRTIYYIVTDATPSGPAEKMGVTNTPSSKNLITNPAAVDLFQFKNGIKGSGPLGFQPGIAASATGDKTYSPMWRIFLVEWHNPDEAVILETKADIDAFQSNGKITVSIAKPMNSHHIVNCPFVDPFQ